MCVGRSCAHFSCSASDLLVDHLIELMAVLNLNNASAHHGFRSCVTLRSMHRDGQLVDYLRDGVDKRGMYLETDPVVGCRYCKGTCRATLVSMQRHRYGESWSR